MIASFRQSAWRRYFSAALVVLLVRGVVSSAEPEAFETLQVEYGQRIQPLLKQFCLDCHSTENFEGELDLERFAQLQDVRRDPQAWQKVAGMLKDGEMPPEDSPQLSKQQQQQLRGWVKRYLEAEALANEGDPGPVVLRRLNNAEYTYTIRDLTGVDLDPAREFPVDGAAGEGFTNTGNSLVMSPSMVTKNFDAAKEIADHAVLLPEGIRFSPGITRRDWTNEILGEIRTIYLRHTGGRGDANVLNHWNVADPKILTNQDGRVDLAPYFTALVAHRGQLVQSVDTVEQIAREEQLNSKYLKQLAEMLVSGKPESRLLDHLRRRWRQATPQEGPTIAEEVRGWQNSLWKYNVVGHFGSIRPWQVPASPIANSESFRVKLNPPGDINDVTLYLVAGTAGDGSVGDLVRWQSPRIERAGRPPILLRDVRLRSLALEKIRLKTLAATSKFLAAAFEARTSKKPPNLPDLAAAHGVEPGMLKAWLSFLGIADGGEVTIKEYLRHPIQNGTYDFVKGWGLAGVGDLSLTSNASDAKVNVPGTVNPHKVVVHPRPERWVAAGWKSPLDGVVRLEPRIQDAHSQCGNGVSWSFELRRGAQRRILEAGNVDLGGETSIKPLEDFVVKRGDLISLVIGPRDGNHGCDLTQIDLTVTEQSGEKRVWSLAGDCAGTIGAGNPHADGYGNPGIWHFYTGMIDGSSSQPQIPPGSLLARWLDANDAQKAHQLALQVESLFAEVLPENTPQADVDLESLLYASDGPIFSRIDSSELADAVTAEELQSSQYGIDPKLFGVSPDGTAISPEHFIVRAPTVIEVRLPGELAAGAEFVATSQLHHDNPESGSVQLQAVKNKPVDIESIRPGLPIVLNQGGKVERRYQLALEQFRHYFPAAMCYPQIVPVDETVTLVLFHREDEHLSRLMLTDQEQERLDVLWKHLHYVSQDALIGVTAFDQLMEFATQDGDPSLYEPLREAIYQRAADYRQQLVETESAHLQSLHRIATRAYRRPLSEQESHRLDEFYKTLREQEMPHEEAIRLTLARVLASPAFLYRLEKPGLGRERSSVSDWELASRLSYFLWSSQPDEELRKSAAAGQLRDTEELQSQTKRMLRDGRMRRLAIEFACQWLHIRDFDQFDEKNERLYPQFAEMRAAMYEESILFFTDLFQNDGSVLEIFDADHTFLNEALAKHYGIPGVRGNHWRRVEDVKKYSRGGILAQATTLSKQSGASRTSAILRGNWVSETLLGERLPRPPKDVPQLPEIVPAGLTERQLITKHSSDPACANCHVRIDPYGFALESFDTIGRFREKDDGGYEIDTRATVMDGTRIEGIQGLRNYLMTIRRETVLKQFCRKLLGYALGRGVQLSDEPLLSKMMSQLAENQYRFSAAIETIILSDQFRKIRGAEHGLAAAHNP